MTNSADSGISLHPPLSFVHACSWKTLIRISVLDVPKKYGAFFFFRNVAVRFGLIVHRVRWSAMRARSLTPESGCRRRGPETGHSDGARGNLRVEKFCSVPPCAGMNPSGASEHHYWEVERGGWGGGGRAG